jgi:hypothetical protein
MSHLEQLDQPIMEPASKNSQAIPKINKFESIAPLVKAFESKSGCRQFADTIALNP